MIKAIIFDCFGVLCNDGWLPLKRQYFGHDQALFEQAGDLNRQVDAGLADYQVFLQTIADLAGISPAEVRRRIEANPPNQELFDYITSELKPNYKLGLLSNAGANWLDDLFSQTQIDLFDAVALSYETGVTKPQPEAYRIIARRLEVAPEDCLFIDDQPAFCEAAEAVGMTALAYHSVEKLRAEAARVLHK